MRWRSANRRCPGRCSGSCPHSLHSIRSQTLDVAVATERLALALQPRLSELNHRRLLPVIDRVLGEFDFTSMSEALRLRGLLAA